MVVVDGSRFCTDLNSFHHFNRSFLVLIQLFLQGEDKSLLRKRFLRMSMYGNNEHMEIMKKESKEKEKKTTPIHTEIFIFAVRSTQQPSEKPYPSQITTMVMIRRYAYSNAFYPEHSSRTMMVLRKIEKILIEIRVFWTATEILFRILSTTREKN